MSLCRVPLMANLHNASARKSLYPTMRLEHQHFEQSASPEKVGLFNSSSLLDKRSCSRLPFKALVLPFDLLQVDLYFDKENTL